MIYIVISMLNFPRTLVRQGVNFVSERLVQISEEKVEGMHRGWSGRHASRLVRA